jgi:hypothetical protein
MAIKHAGSPNLYSNGVPWTDDPMIRWSGLTKMQNLDTLRYLPRTRNAPPHSHTIKASYRKLPKRPITNGRFPLTAAGARASLRPAPRCFSVRAPLITHHLLWRGEGAWTSGHGGPGSTQRARSAAHPGVDRRPASEGLEFLSPLPLPPAGGSGIEARRGQCWLAWAGGVGGGGGAAAPRRRRWRTMQSLQTSSRTAATRGAPRYQQRGDKTRHNGVRTIGTKNARGKAWPRSASGIPAIGEVRSMLLFCARAADYARLLCGGGGQE